MFYNFNHLKLNMQHIDPDIFSIQLMYIAVYNTSNSQAVLYQKQQNIKYITEAIKDYQINTLFRTSRTRICSCSGLISKTFAPWIPGSMV